MPISANIHPIATLNPTRNKQKAAPILVKSARNNSVVCYRGGGNAVKTFRFQFGKIYDGNEGRNM
jgi:hypothetical protein